MTRLRILDVPVDVLGFEEAVTTVLGWMADPASRTAHFCNVHLVVTAHDSRGLLEMLHKGTLNATDGMPIVWMAGMLGARGERVPGPDLMRSVMDRGRALGARHYLYGGAPGVAEALERRLAAELPGLQVVGSWSPPFRPPTPDEVEAGLLGRRGARSAARCRPDGGRGRLRLPQRREAPSAPLDAADGARVALPAVERTPAAVAPLRGHEHEVPFPRRAAARAH